MTAYENQSQLIDMIREMRGRLNRPDMDYFNLLGLNRTAILKDIEAAYLRVAEALSPERIEALEDPALRGQAQEVRRVIQRAFEVLSDYGKRAEYEKRGFREASAEDQPEEDPLDVAKALYRKAKTLYSRQDYATAIKALEQAIQLDPKKADHYYLLGLCQSRVSSLKRDAEKNLLRALDMEPWNAEHHVALGMLFYSEKMFARAESYFRQALSKEPGHLLARKKLTEIVGPEKTGMDAVKEGLQKVFPTFFKKKK